VTRTLRLDRRQTLASGLAAALGAATPAWADDARSFKMFDGHLHLVSDDLVRYPRTTIAPPGAIGPGGPPAPGASVQVGQPRLTPTAEQALKWMDEAGVEVAAAVQRRSSYALDNSYILDSAQAHPDRFWSVVVLEAADAATPGVIRDLAKTREIAGLRITGTRERDGSYPWLNSEAALATWAAMDALGLTMDLIYAPQQFSPEALTAILGVARKFPRVRIVIDHVGWSRIEGAPGYGIGDQPAGLVSQPNVHFKFTTGNLNILLEAKISASGFLRHAVDRLGAGRVLWGSDMGSSHGTYADMVSRAWAAAALLTPAEQRAVFRDTGRAAFIRRA
jgi:predicted TIM-barrel fold metal-dependent hydrolase